jgi:hypothetical protein
LLNLRGTGLATNCLKQSTLTDLGYASIVGAALEAGTSREMVFKNYRAPVTAGAAKEWFAVTPGSAERAKQRSLTRVVAGAAG